ncbi:MAG: HAD family hydrolase [Bacteroides sp.]|nr:HAD family hydrolase [Bacteroides sp.]MCM1421162.1 HAD family hydrolase [Bacteroides sp.]
MNIKGIIFDYGGTIDTNSTHWSEVLWEGFLNSAVPVSKEQFRECYVHGERTLAKFPLIKPEHNFLDLLRIKVDIETEYLSDNGFWTIDEEPRKRISNDIARYCYDYVLRVLHTSREVIARLAEKYPLVLVSNFYGNIQTILRDFRLEYFQSIVESAVVGVRKPDPRIFQLGVDALGLPPEEVVVVGDSFSKDIIPASSIGCKTVWIRGIGWGNETIDESVPTAILSDIAELPQQL